MSFYDLFLLDCSREVLLAEPRRLVYLSLEDPEVLAVVDREDLLEYELCPVPADRLSVFVYLPVPVPLAVLVLRLEAVEPAEPDSRLLLRTLFLSLEMRGVRLVSGESS